MLSALMQHWLATRMPGDGRSGFFLFTLQRVQWQRFAGACLMGQPRLAPLLVGSAC